MTAIGEPGTSQRPLIVRLVPRLDFGGVETIVQVQAESLSGNYDFEVWTLCDHGRIARDIEDLGVTVRCLEVDPSVGNPRATFRLASMLRTHRPSLMHCCVGEGIFHGTIAATLSRTPIITEEVGIPTRSRLAQRIFGRLHRRSRAIIGVSREVCDYLAKMESAPEDRLVRLLNAVQGRFFQPVVPAQRTGRVVTVGRLVEEKNFAVLLQAWSNILEDCPRARLQIAGDGPERAQLQVSIRDLGLQGSVELLGQVDDVIPLLDSAELFVLPSVREGFGIAAAEAMARSRPILVNSKTGMREVIEGLSFPAATSANDPPGWANAITTVLLLNEDDFQERCRLARQLAETRFGHQVYSRALELLYLTALKTTALPSELSYRASGTSHK